MSSQAMKKMSTSLSSHAFAGKTGKTASGLSKGDVVKKKRGSNEHAALERQCVWEGEFGHLQSKNSPWIAALASARKAQPNIKGGIKKGSPLYKAVMAPKNWASA